MSCPAMYKNEYENNVKTKVLCNQDSFAPTVKNIQELKSLCSKRSGLIVVFGLFNKASSQIFKDALVHFYQSSKIQKKTFSIVFIGADEANGI